MSKRSTFFQNPLISGILIGAAGGAIGTFIYELIKETRYYSKLDSVSNLTLKILNLSYRIPLFVVVLALIAGLAMLIFYLKKSTKS